MKKKKIVKKKKKKVEKPLSAIEKMIKKETDISGFIK